MKKIVCLILFLLACQFEIYSQQPVVSSGPKIKFDSEVVDYGKIEYEANGDREFKFKNIGKESLELSNVNSSCGCLVPSWPKEPIKPGNTAIIKARYDTKRVGRFEKTLTVTSNDPERPTIVLKIKGEVLPAK